MSQKMTATTETNVKDHWDHLGTFFRDGNQNSVLAKEFEIIQGIWKIRIYKLEFLYGPIYGSGYF